MFRLRKINIKPTMEVDFVIALNTPINSTTITTCRRYNSIL